MFGWIRENWREARGIELAKEFKQIVAMARRLTRDGRQALASEIVLQIGEWEVVFEGSPPGQQKHIIREAKRAGQQLLDQGYRPQLCAVAIVMSYLEAGALPGGAARLVRADAGMLIHLAREVTGQADFILPDSVARWDPLSPLFKEAMREAERHLHAKQ